MSTLAGTPENLFRYQALLQKIQNRVKGGNITPEDAFAQLASAYKDLVVGPLVRLHKISGRTPFCAPMPNCSTDHTVLTMRLFTAAFAAFLWSLLVGRCTRWRINWSGTTVWTATSHFGN
jgi:hypothetical protein